MITEVIIHCSIITWEWSLHLSLTIGVDSNPLKWRRPIGHIRYNGCKRCDNTPKAIARAGSSCV